MYLREVLPYRQEGSATAATPFSDPHGSSAGAFLNTLEAGHDDVMMVVKTEDHEAAKYLAGLQRLQGQNNESDEGEPEGEGNDRGPEQARRSVTLDE